MLRQRVPGLGEGKKDRHARLLSYIACGHYQDPVHIFGVETLHLVWKKISCTRANILLDEQLLFAPWTSFSSSRISEYQCNLVSQYYWPSLSLLRNIHLDWSKSHHRLRFQGIFTKALSNPNSGRKLTPHIIRQPLEVSTLLGTRLVLGALLLISLQVAPLYIYNFTIWIWPVFLLKHPSFSARKEIKNNV